MVHTNFDTATSSAPSVAPTWPRRILREPLAHFLVIGALIFGADQVIVAVRGTPQDIVVSKEAYQEARQAFVAGMKREPTPAELKVLTARWVDNEVLYREGLALGLDQGDQAMRERVIFKALSLAQAGLVLPKIDEAGLRAWFDSRRERYDVPARYDFEEAVVNATGAAPDTLQKFALALNDGQTPDANGSLRIFKNRPRQNLDVSYGGDFANALTRSQVGLWSVVQTRDGPRVVRLVATTPGQSIRFEDIKESVYRDWKEYTSTELTKNAIRDIARKYRIRDEGKVS